MNSKEQYVARFDELVRNGKVAEAIAVMEGCLQSHPDFPAAIHRFGMFLASQGNAAGAVFYLEKVVSIEPRNNAYRNDLGMCLEQAGRRQDAIAAFQCALELEPKSEAALNNLGLILLYAGKANEALPYLRMATTINSGFANAQNNLGNALSLLGDYTTALKAYEDALAAAPGYASAHRNKIICFSYLKRYAEQIAAAEQLLSIAPGDAIAQYYIAAALIELGFPERALPILTGLGAGGATGAVFFNTIARAELEAGSPVLAEKHYASALHAEPEDVPALVGHVLCLAKQGKWKESRLELSRLSDKLTDAAYAAEVFGWMLFTSQCDPEISPAERFELHQSFGKKFASDGSIYVSDISRDPDKKLRVGFLSPDFRHHSIATFFLPVAQQLDHSSMEFIGYSTGTHHDDVTAQFQTAFNEWNDVRAMRDDQLSRKIALDRIDILVDLALHSAGNRILTLARKPAPVQATWLGYSGTTGVKSVDYHITDMHMNPHGITDCVYTEQLARIEGSAVVFQPGTISIQPRQREPTSPFTFGCLSQLMKLNNRVAKVWSSILNQLPTATLLIGNVTSSFEREHVVNLFRPHLRNLAQLTLEPKLGFDAYLDLHNRIDLMLDTFPYSGGTTTGYSMWMGVPVLTLDEPTPTPRMPGISLMRMAGLDDFIAPSSEDYESLAVSMTTRREYLQDLRLCLRNRLKDSPLNQPKRLATDLQFAFRKLWGTWCSNSRASGLQ